jgi:hypothetical protein
MRAPQSLVQTAQIEHGFEAEQKKKGRSFPAGGARDRKVIYFVPTKY